MTFDTDVSTDATADRPRSDGGGVAGLLAGTVSRLRASPAVFLPYGLFGPVAALYVLVLQWLRLPVGFTPYPDRGFLALQLAFVPGFGIGAEVPPGVLPGLKQPFLLAAVGLFVGTSLALAVALATALWLADPGREGVVPPLSRIGWLFLYVLVAQGSLFGVGYLATTEGQALFVVVALVVLAAVALFLLPAYVVLDGRRPLAAAGASVDAALARPVTFGALVVGLSYLQYLLTGVAVAVPVDPWAGAVGVAVATAVGGTLWVAVVATCYRAGATRGRAVH